MAWGEIALSGGLELLKAGLSYSAAKEKTKNERAWQAYNNTMLQISAGQAQNSITTNQNLARERSIEQGVAIRKSQFLTSASAEASAAASGTIGRSVNAVMFDIQRNAANADAKRINDAENQEIGFNDQRQKIAQQAASQQDLRTIPSPSLATTMLGLAGEGLKIYKGNQTEIDSYFRKL